MTAPLSRTAIAAILAGVLYFAGQAGELAFSSSNDGDAVFVALGLAGIVHWVSPSGASATSSRA